MPYSSGIIDAKRNLYVEISRVDCKKGVPGDPNNCPFALAIKRTIPGCIRAVVGVNYIFIHTNTTSKRYMTPPEIANLIRGWDKRKKIGSIAGSYRLEAPWGRFTLERVRQQGLLRSRSTDSERKRPANGKVPKYHTNVRVIQQRELRKLEAQQ